MTDKKITDLDELSTPANDDVFPIVDVSDLTDSAEGTTKKIKQSNLFPVPPTKKAFATVGFDAESDYICDGTDDDVQIQDALNTVGLTGGIVHIKPGNYSLSRFIYIPSYVIMEGEGFATVLKLKDGATGDLTDGLIVPGGIVGGGVILDSGVATTYGAILRNFKLDANRQGQSGLTSNQLYGIEFIWTSNCRIEDVWVTNTFSSGIGMWPSNSTPAVHCESVITRCRVDNCNVSIGEGGQGLDAGIFVSNGTSLPGRVMVSDCIAIGNYNGICVEDSSGGVSISNCQAIENTNDGICFVTAYGTQVSNCFCYKNARNGIGTNGAGERFIAISNCICRENLYGIATGHDWSITGGMIYYNKEAGITLTGTNVVVSGVRIGRNGKGTTPTYPYGIYQPAGASDNLVVGCFIGASQNADTAPETQTYGIFEAGSASNQYVGNRFYTPAATADIALGAGSTSKKKSNRGDGSVADN